MMRFGITCFLSLFFLSFLTAQPFGHPAIKNADEIIYFGLDFSKAKMIGSEGFSNPDDIKARFFRSWNMVLVNEASKYDLKKAFKKDVLRRDFSVIDERNTLPDAATLVINSDYKITREDVEDVVKDYNGEYNSGVGLVFIIESFNKTGEIGKMWVTFFDIESKEVLVTRRYSGEPGGFGLRNYWVRTVYNVINQVGNDYSEWLRDKKR